MYTTKRYILASLDAYTYTLSIRSFGSNYFFHFTHMAHTMIDALNWRFATRVFDPTKNIAEADLDTILESARLTASSFGIEAWKFIVVEDPKVRAALRAAGYDQPKITDASALVVLAARTDIRENISTELMERTAKIKGVTVEDLAGYKQMVDGAIGMRDDAALAAWASAQTYIALGTMMATASLLAIDNGPMEGFDPVKVDEILGLPAQHLHATTMLALGYRGEDPGASAPKVRRAKDEVITFVK